MTKRILHFEARLRRLSLRSWAIIAIIVILLLLASAMAGAAVFGGSNLGIGGYPRPYCHKPYKPYQFRSQMEVDNYNADVGRYVHCVKTYIQNANNDIDRIQEEERQLVEEVRIGN